MACLWAEVGKGTGPRYIHKQETTNNKQGTKDYDFTDDLILPASLPFPSLHDPAAYPRPSQIREQQCKHAFV